MNRSLELALHFSNLPERVSQTQGAKKWVLFQETGQRPSGLSKGDQNIFDELCVGFQWAGVQVLTWIDEIVDWALSGFGWYWFWAGYEDAPLPTKRMIKSLRRSVEKNGLTMFLARHPKFKHRPRWQEVVFEHHGGARRYLND